MKCKKCKVEHDGSFGSGRFCSKKCANSRTFSEESCKKKSEANKRFLDKNGKWGGQLDNNCDPEKLRETWRKKHASMSWDELGKITKRKTVILDQDGCCQKCGLCTWQGEQLKLEIEHINGDHQDNSRENLIALCPNCHSLTPTWRGRNKSKNKGRFTDQEIWLAYQECGTIHSALIFLGYAAKGSNYVRAKRIVNRNLLLTFKKKLEN